MAKQQTQTIDPEGGFISAKKGINLSLMGLIVWVITLVLYRIISLIISSGVNNESFCLIVSLSLSILSGIYVSKALYKKNEPDSRVIACVMNIFLIYTSANGIQAGHSAIAGTADSKTGTAVLENSLFGFLDARPWLPDVFSKQTIRELKTENIQLRESLSLADKPITNPGSGEIGRGEIARLRNEIAILTQQNSDANKQLDILKGRIRSFNELQMKWMAAEEKNPDFRATAMRIRKMIDVFLGQDFYPKFFQTPIDMTIQ